MVASPRLSNFPHMRLNKFGPYISFYFPVFMDIIGIFSQCLEISSILYMALMLFSNFVMLLNWQSYMRIFSKNWQYSKFESRKIFSILSCCRQLELWQFLLKIHVLHKKKRRCERILFFQNMTKICAKNHWSRSLVWQSVIWCCDSKSIPILTPYSGAFAIQYLVIVPPSRPMYIVWSN